jgi:hypothetical protein
LERANAIFKRGESGLVEKRGRLLNQNSNLMVSKGLMLYGSELPRS